MKTQICLFRARTSRMLRILTHRPKSARPCTMSSNKESATWRRATRYWSRSNMPFNNHWSWNVVAAARHISQWSSRHMFFAARSCSSRKRLVKALPKISKSNRCSFRHRSTLSNRRLCSLPLRHRWPSDNEGRPTRPRNSWNWASSKICF